MKYTNAKPAPYKCPKCPPSSFYGKLVFLGDEIPVCPNSHKDNNGEERTPAEMPVLLVPSRV